MKISIQMPRDPTTGGMSDDGRAATDRLNIW